MTVVRLGAWCDFVTEQEYRVRLAALSAPPTAPSAAVTSAASPAVWAPLPQDVEQAVEEFKRGACFDVQEFAVLADGRRLTLHCERGFSTVRHTTGSSAPVDPWSHLTLEHLESDVRTTVLPDEDDTEDQHPWEWLAGLLRAHGVEVSPESLRGLPYDVVFSERLRARVEAARQ